MASPSAPLPVISLSRLQEGSAAERSALRTALTEHGFFYLGEHGISPALIDAVFELQADFFSRPDEEKAIGIDRATNLGWTPIQQERLDEGRTGSNGDLKESFYIGDGIVSNGDHHQTLPPSLEQARTQLEALWNEARRVVLQLLDGFASVVGVEPGFFAPHHTGGLDRLRMIHYPPAPATAQSEDGDIRASQHSDYGSCTLLFQKDVGGLQVKLRSASLSAVGQDADTWIDVPPRPGLLVCNVADAMEFWTGGQLRSTIHRVRMPQDESEAGQSRYSIAFFAQPDEHTSLDPALLLSGQRGEEEESSAAARLAEQRAVLAQLLRAKSIPLSAEGKPPTGGEYLSARLRATYS
ncbi:hypothetical protein OC835_005452 [Tilletia horrida]|uniref:Fe2OG dioxygenase domain-containing protein n=1 Tax=Tilletia horrida TaxID=155126 RepID=A0AAN6G7M8_9BASI|nr:hypothetical protein OC842_005538 [Tilletia horrida]KAK0525911.1 hypothetical protein OC835_005452 [Tilletia horrida]